MGFLAWLENTEFSMWVAQSPSWFAYPFILTLHTVGLAMLVGASVFIDLRMLGVARNVPFDQLRPLTRTIWIGFVLNALSGVIVLAAAATVLGTMKTFYLKLAFIALALIVDARLRSAIFSDPVSYGRPNPPAPARMLATLSLLLWAGAITAGRLMAYV